MRSQQLAQGKGSGATTLTLPLRSPPTLPLALPLTPLPLTLPLALPLTLPLAAGGPRPSAARCSLLRARALFRGWPCLHQMLTSVRPRTFAHGCAPLEEAASPRCPTTWRGARRAATSRRARRSQGQGPSDTVRRSVSPPARAFVTLNSGRVLRAHCLTLMIMTSSPGSQGRTDRSADVSVPWLAGFPEHRSLCPCSSPRLTTLRALCC